MDHLVEWSSGSMLGLGFEASWQQLQRDQSQAQECLVDTLHEAIIQEELGWQPVLLSGGRGCQAPLLDAETHQGLNELENCLQFFLLGRFSSAAPATQVVEGFSEVVIPQFHSRSGCWKLSA